MAERVLLEEQGVLVTTSRVATGRETFVIRNITSMRTDQHNKIGDAFLCGAVFAAVVSALVWSASGFSVWFVAACWVALAGLVGYAYAKPCYRLFLVTAAGEAKAIESRDHQFFERVVAATNEAIAANDENAAQPVCSQHG